MNRFESITKTLGWFMALLLAAFVAGCGSSGDGVPDTTAPIVSYTIPASGGTDIAIDRKITATFSEGMDPATITGTTFTLTGPGTTAVTGSVTYAAGARTAIFTPAASLPAGTLFTATITTAVTDLAGNALAVTKTWSFTTGATADTILPTVSSTIPVNAASGVVRNTNVTATFSEAMDAATITDMTFTLMRGTTHVSGAVTYVGTSAVFNPASNLAAGTLYTATVTGGTGGVKDLAGNALVSDYVWSFTTGTTVAAGPKPVSLGTAGNYAILAKTGVSYTPIAIVTSTPTITGNIGVSPNAATSITGFSLVADPTNVFSTSTWVVGNIYAANYAVPTPANLTTAVLNMEAAYTDAAGRTATSAATTNVGAGSLISLTLTPGVYEWGSNVTIPTNLTLNGASTDVWIFKVAGTLDMAANKSVILSGGASPKNIFWQVSESVNIGTGTHFEGVVLGQTLISMGTGSSINGRLLAQTAVTLDSTTVTQP